MSDDALPLCACEQYYDSHHPECPARRAYEAALLKLETSQVALKGAEERAKMLLDAKSHWAERARTAESKLEAAELREKGLRRKIEITEEYATSRLCPDHRGKWERDRCVMCELDHESAAVERTVTVWNLQDSRSVQLCGGCGDAIDGDHICVSRHAAQELERLRTDISTLRAEIAELKARRVGVGPGDGLIGGCGGRESE